MTFKFNIGDKIRLTGDGHYFLDESETLMEPGDIVTIKDRQVSDSWLGEDANAYSFQEDDDNGEPNWLDVETNFELVPLTLKQLLEEL